MIDADNTFALLGVMMVVVTLAIFAERTRIGSMLSATLMIMGGTIALSNSGIIPYSAPLYSLVSSVLVPLAIPLLLLRADLKRVFTETGPMLIAFLLATAVTVVGAFVGAALLDLGDSEAAITGVLAASYIGGSLNFVSTAKAVGFDSSELYVAALSADTLGALVFLMLLMLLPAIGFVRRAMPSPFIGGSGQVGTAADAPIDSSGPLTFHGLALGLAISAVICGVSKALVTVFDANHLFILVITVLTLLVANFARPLVKPVSGEFEVGTLFMYLFFGAIAAGANIGEVIAVALPMLIFIIVMLGVHMVLLVFFGSLMKLDLAEVMIASNACILGPATAAGMAAGRGWRPLITPGMLVGVLGYAIGTFIGIAITNVLA